MPVTGVRQHHAGRVTDPGAREFGLGGKENRFKVAEVRVHHTDLHGQHDVLFVDRGLRVVALRESTRFERVA
jgi:hypothetical protein